MGGLKHRPPETSPLQAKRDGAVEVNVFTSTLGEATVRRRQGGHEAGQRYQSSIFKNSFSEIIFTSSFWAFSYFDPASSPATT